MDAAPPSTEARTSQDWSGLRPAQSVLVYEPLGEAYAAIVDAVTEDSSVVWVVCERYYHRRAFDCREGVIVAPS